MTVQVSLVVDGIDLDSEVTLTRIAETLADMAWSRVDGRVLVSFPAPVADPVPVAIRAAERIRESLGRSVGPIRVDEDLVGIVEIARRTGVSATFVSRWRRGERGGGGFPAPMVILAGQEHGTPAWAWRRIRFWLADTQGMALEATLSDPQIAAINLHLSSAEAPKT